MIEAAKELTTLLKDLPELAIWILILLFAYKVVVIGSVVGVIRLGIDKIHDFMTKPKEITRKVCINERFDTSETTFDEFASAIHELTGGKRYITRGHIIWLRERIKCRNAHATSSTSGTTGSDEQSILAKSDGL